MTCRPMCRVWAFAEHGKKYWVRDRRWKLYDNGRLYDVANDPGEKTPVAVTGQDAKVKSVRERLTAALTSLNYQ